MTIWWWLAQHLLITALLVTVVALACRLIPSRPALRHALWVVVLIKFLMPPWIAWPVSIAQFAPTQWIAQQSSLPTTDSPGAVLTATTLAPAEQGEQNLASAFESEDLAGQLPIPVAPDEPDPAPGLSPELTVLPEPTVVAEMPTSAPSCRQSPGPLRCTVARRRSMVAALAHWRRSFAATAGHVDSRQPGCCRRPIVAHRTLRPPRAASSRRARVLADRNGPAGAHHGSAADPDAAARDVASPFVWCLGRLQLIWPAQLADPAALARWQGVIAHELAHVRRRDHWIAWLELLASVVWWWNPLFWIARRQMSEAAEMACDALALGLLPDGRKAYAEAFLELSLPPFSREPAPALGAGSPSRKSFERRFTMILSPRVVSRISWPGLLVAAALAVVAVPSWSLGQSDAPPAVAPTPGDQPAPPAPTRPVVVPTVVAPVAEPAATRPAIAPVAEIPGASRLPPANRPNPARPRQRLPRRPRRTPGS